MTPAGRDDDGAPVESDLDDAAPSGTCAVRSLGVGETLLDPAPSGSTRDDAFCMPLSPGQLLLDKYELQSLLGVGRISFVVAALHRGFNRQVALKLLKPEFAADIRALQSFAREARSHFELRSEHVVRVFDADRLPDGRPFLVMERLHGLDLRALLGARGRLSIERASEFVLQTCQALAAAHRAGIVHGHLTPQKLFVTELGAEVEVVKLLDLGACPPPLDEAPNLGTKPDSPPDVPPEQEPCELDIGADIRALGSLLQALLTGPGAVAPQRMVAAEIALFAPAQRVTKQREAAAELRAVIARCSAAEPDQRFQNVAELAAALAPFAPARGRKHAERCARLQRGQAIDADEEHARSLDAEQQADAELESVRVAPNEPLDGAPPRARRGALAKLALATVSVSTALVLTYVALGFRAPSAAPSGDGKRTPATLAAPTAPAAPVPTPTVGSPAPPPPITVEQLDVPPTTATSPRELPGPAPRAVRSARASKRARRALEATDALPTVGASDRDDRTSQQPRRRRALR